jgi:starch-binding outer membrane protein, SusD/RagB family
MKNIRIKVFALLFIATLSGCFELDKMDPNRQNEDTFWVSEDNLRMGAYACYDQVQEYWADRLQYLYTGLSDEGTNEYPYEFNDFVRFKGDDLDAFSDDWNHLYELIGRAYQVIGHADGIEGPNVAAITAEARFFVALGYYHLQVIFGDHVALVEDIQSPADKPARAETAQIYGIMERELNKAIPDLPLASDYSTNEYGLVSKGAAQALLAKVYMQQHKYAEAEAEFKKVIESEEYSLNKNYAVNFDGTEFVNPEAIFIANYVFDGPEGPESNDYSIRPQLFSLRETKNTWGDVQATNFILEEFNKELDKDGNPDPRRDETIFHENSSKTYYGENWEFWYYGNDEEDGVLNPDIKTMFYKYSDQNSVNANGGNVTPQVCGTDFIIIRYADVLLLYAEALNQNDKTGEAYTYVNMVRDRSNMNPLTPGLSSLDFLAQLKHERVVELAGELVRIEDLKRWGDYGPNSAVNDPNFETFTVGRSELAPIPQSEIDLNNNLTQNPGY